MSTATRTGPQYLAVWKIAWIQPGRVRSGSGMEGGSMSGQGMRGRGMSGRSTSGSGMSGQGSRMSTPIPSRGSSTLATAAATCRAANSLGWRRARRSRRAARLPSGGVNQTSPAPVTSSFRSAWAGSGTTLHMLSPPRQSAVTLTVRPSWTSLTALSEVRLRSTSRPSTSSRMSWLRRDGDDSTSRSRPSSSSAQRSGAVAAIESPPGDGRLVKASGTFPRVAGGGGDGHRPRCQVA